MTVDVIILAGAMVCDATFGYPQAVFARVGHPVSWMGALLALLDRRLNRDRASDIARRLSGILALALLLASSLLPAAWLQQAVLRCWPTAVALALLSVLAGTLIAQRSLWTHVSDVADALDHEGLVGGRAAVGRIVGRNPAYLDEAGVVRAAIESLAENFADGVVAPAFWCACAGLPGIAAYKAINTADSMIGHRTPRHAAFGWASARLDDAVNLPASRLAAMLITLAAATAPGANAPAGWRAVWRDARRHRSPNAGWPEAAMAGALGLALAGPRVYGETRIEDAWMGDGRRDATVADIRRALAIYRRACVMGFMVVVLLAVGFA